MGKATKAKPKIKNLRQGGLRSDYPPKKCRKLRKIAFKLRKICGEIAVSGKGFPDREKNTSPNRAKPKQRKMLHVFG